MEYQDLVHFQSFNVEKEQTKWIIKRNLTEDELEYEDIMVINCNPLTTKNDVAEVRALLFNMGINSHLAGVSTSPDEFFQPDSITFTSIYRAKGNEAAMIYVMNAQHCYKGFDLSSKRNILFTALTRSKAWVRVTGFGERMQNLIEEEFHAIKEKNFELDFKYPNTEELKKMNIVNRDMTKDEKREIKAQVTNVETFFWHPHNSSLAADCRHIRSSWQIAPIAEIAL